MRVLITGAGGFIGSHMVDRCKRDGHHVMALDIKYIDDWIVGEQAPDEIYDEADVVDVLYDAGQFDVVYHLAAESRIQPSFDIPVECIRSNVLGTAAVLDCARKYKARVVYAGSSTADDDVAKNVYATSKFQGERLCKTWANCFGVSVGIARFYNVYGPRHIKDGRYATVIGIFERQFDNGEKLTVTGTGAHKRDFTHVNDIVEGLVQISKQTDNDEYALGSGVNHSILSVAKMFVRDDRITFIDRPPGESEVTLANIYNTRKKLKWFPFHVLESYINEYKCGQVPC